MSFLSLFMSLFLREKKKTAAVAKERLQIILAHERISRNAGEHDYLPDLQRELIAVISKYVKIDPKDIKVKLEQRENLDVLEVKIELPEKPEQSGPAQAGPKAVA
jgi:cell division topological specificity factor